MAPVVVPDLVMLHPTDDDARCNADRLGKRLDIGIGRQSAELLCTIGRDEEVCGKRVGFVLQEIVVGTVVDEGLLLRVQEASALPRGRTRTRRSRPSCSDRSMRSLPREGLAHHAAPLMRQPLTSGTKTTTTPAAAHISTMRLGSPSAVSERISLSTLRNSEAENGSTLAGLCFDLRDP